jgi:hypothetical protein
LWNAIIALALFRIAALKTSRGSTGALSSPDADDMDSGDFVFGRQGDDSEFLHRFGLEVQYLPDRVITSPGAGDAVIANIILAGIFFDLF